MANPERRKDHDFYPNRFAAELEEIDAEHGISAKPEKKRPPKEDSLRDGTVIHDLGTELGKVADGYQDPNAKAFEQQQEFEKLSDPKKVEHLITELLKESRYEFVRNMLDTETARQKLADTALRKAQRLATRDSKKPMNVIATARTVAENLMNDEVTLSQALVA